MGYAVMGTAVRSGENRAIAAAQAAMASPLLEAGAIDGARGILINISGSSSLKLSEVNEASTLIQSAAHEDANIIFGAVLDESMGNEVKITVIATGFRQDLLSRGHRLERDALMPHVRIEQRPSTPRFASEEFGHDDLPNEPARVSVREQPAFVPRSGTSAIAEPAPVAAAPSAVLPPIFTEAPREETRPGVDRKTVTTYPIISEVGFDEPFEEEYARLIPDRNPERSAATNVVAEPAETDQAENLDIPAFLRRGNL
jgi:cell division protein FtsZ